MGYILTRDDAIAQREALRWANQTLVFTNGHFDLLHVGHLDYLEKARVLGDVLYVGLNGDECTRRLKGAGRPLVPAVERARLLAALTPVSGVVIFEEDTAVELIKVLRPEVYVKGGDYGTHNGDQLVLKKPLPEQTVVEAYGGHIALIDYLPDHSTTTLIQRIKALPE
ncbi:MAG: adenylyltransferase/cytidyltransferase family protein [Anaerolineae bacterium]